MTEVEATLFELEKRLQSDSVRRQAQEVGALLTDDFQEFGSTGKVYGKAEIVAALRDETARQIVMQDFAVRRLGETVALATYRARIGPSDAPEAVESMRSSVWVLESGEWRMAFHQGTTIR